VETIEANPNPEKVEENETKPDDDEVKNGYFIK
jgi:hypothetical protein